MPHPNSDDWINSGERMKEMAWGSGQDENGFSIRSLDDQSSRWDVDLVGNLKLIGGRFQKQTWISIQAWS